MVARQLPKLQVRVRSPSPASQIIEPGEGSFCFAKSPSCFVVMSSPDLVSVADAMSLLSSSAIFAGIGDEMLDAVYQAAHRRRVRAREYFFHQDEEATTFYLLLEGRARLVQLTPEGHQVIIRYVGPGDGVGIIVALSEVPYPLSAEAVTDCLALAWDRATTMHFMESNATMALNGMRMVAQRFRDLQGRYRELATERVERRVARTLLRLTRQTGKRVTEGVLLDLPLSRQDLGELTGTTLYTVSRILSRWEQDGLITTGRERVIVCKPHALVAIAEDLPPVEPRPNL